MVGAVRNRLPLPTSTEGQAGFLHRLAGAPVEGRREGVRVIRPIKDGPGLFHDEPDDLASTVEARGLRLIERGRSGEQIGVLPYLEEEAIARLRHAMLPLGDGEEAGWRREGPEKWRMKWVLEAQYFMRHSKQGPINATAAYCAGEMLIRASELRHAIKDRNAERAAALAMLVASWVFSGGSSVRLSIALPAAAKHGAYRKKQQAKAMRTRATIQADGEGVRKRDLVDQALKVAGDNAGTPDVWPHLYAVLDSHGMEPRESGAKDTRKIHAIDAAGRPVIFTFKGVQDMLRKLRTCEGPTRGRPKKKPA